MRQIRYQQIATDLRNQILDGELSAGQTLPSESSLGATHEASRVTVRKALEVLRAEGLVDARQGFGWFVASDPIRQPLDTLGTIDAQLTGSGRSPERRVIDFKFVDSPDHVAEALGARALEVRRVNLADGRPFARVTVWCREDLGARVSKAEVEDRSFFELLPIEFGKATQTIGADLAGAEDADLLEVDASSPVLVVKRVTTAATGDAVLVSEHVFPGHLTEFVVDLATAKVDSPPGLRLVEDAG